MEHLKNTNEFAPSIVVTPDPMESLFSPGNNTSPWPQQIKENKLLKHQAELRTSLNSKLGAVFAAVPQATTDIREAIESKKIQSIDAAEMYEAFSDVFQSDPLNARLALYIPFELLPDKTWEPDSEELNLTAKKFGNIYMKAWHTLLNERDIRANFADGDIPERAFRKGPLPEVIKAAHLIPVLVQKNLLSISEVIQLAEHSKDDVLKNSIADTLPILADMNLLKESDMQRLSDSSDQLLSNMAIIIKSTPPKTEETKNQEEENLDKAWLKNIIPDIKKSFEQIENKQQAKQSGITDARVKWLIEIQEKKILDTYSKKIVQALSQKTLRTEDIHELLVESRDQHLVALATQSIRHADDHTTKQNPFDIPFESKQNKIESELGEVKDIANIIESNEELSKFLYPVSIMYGSKIKGYSSEKSDIDIAVFVKPNTDIQDRKHIKDLFAQLLVTQHIKDKPLEFWLEQNGDTLRIKDFTSADKSLGNSAIAYVLLHGAWCGKNETIKELYAKLLSEYLYSKNKKIFDEDARKVYLLELERDALQYRLMHKGYARHYPEQGGIKTANASGIDPDSMFWDSGYRRVATKLFLKKVFLPQLEK